MALPGFQCKCTRHCRAAPRRGHVTTGCDGGGNGHDLASLLSVRAAGFRLVVGTPAKFRSSVHATRTVCPTCGTQLTFADDCSPDEIDISTCSFDEPTAAPPRDHTDTASQLG